MTDLTTTEISSLFQSVQVVGRLVTKAYKADGLSIACQDGPAAGQSVPHVHVHIIPRTLVDRFANTDDIYPELEDHDRKLEGIMQSTSSPSNSAAPQDSSAESASKSDRSLFRVDNEGRKPRSLEEMEKEAQWLNSLIDDVIINGET